VLLLIAVELWGGAVVALFGSNFETSQTLATGVPNWYAAALLVYLLVNALMEETIGRGYMLDRLMPSHPGSLSSSLPAVLVVSALGMLYHVPEYILSYHFSPVSALYNLVFVFLSFAFVGFGYVRSRARNVSGPILVHFLLDAVPYFLLL